MNSLYGRLGPERKNIFNQSAIVEDITAISIHHSISINFKFNSGVKPLKPPGTGDYDRRNIQVPDSVNAEGYGMHTNVCIAAAITANARLIKGRLKDIVAYRISSNRIPFDYA